MLNSFEPFFNMLLSFKNVSENFLIESNRIFHDIFQSNDGVMVGRGPRLIYQILIILMINPSSFKSERPRSFGKGEATKSEEEGIMV